MSMPVVIQIISDPLINKLAFDGYHVRFYNHETRRLEDNHYPTAHDVTMVGFSQEEFPDAETFAEDTFNVYGDTVGQITDNKDNVLYDNMQEMNDIYESMNNWP